MALIFITRLVSGFIFSVVIVKLLADGLAKAGVLKSYPVGEKYTVDMDE
jgi:ABC-type thiamin/hydroxymethylpyrimidine transport system permease subunit